MAAVIDVDGHRMPGVGPAGVVTYRGPGIAGRGRRRRLGGGGDRLVAGHASKRRRAVADNLPVRADHAEVAAGEAGVAGAGVGEPEHHVAVGVAPEDVGLAVAVVVADRLDAPVAGDHPHVDDAEAGEPGPGIREVELDVAVGVAPEHAVLADAIEVADLLQRPARAEGAEVNAGEAGEPGAAVGEIDLDVAAAAVAPEDVSLAVAVEVADALNAPAGGDDPDILAGEAGEPGAGVGQVEFHIAVDVAPEDVGLAVVVEIADLLDRPAGRDHAEVLAREASEPGAGVGEVELNVAVAVAPEDVGLAVAVEVADLLDRPAVADEPKRLVRKPSEPAAAIRIVKIDASVGVAPEDVRDAIAVEVVVHDKGAVGYAQDKVFAIARARGRGRQVEL